MKMLKGLLIIIGLLFATAVYADPPAGKGMGKGVTTGTVTGTPPGLTGKTVKGLSGKTPHGWTQGKKKGWSKVHHHRTKVKTVKGTRVVTPR